MMDEQRKQVLGAVSKFEMNKKCEYLNCLHLGNYPAYG